MQGMVFCGEKASVHNHIPSLKSLVGPRISRQHVVLTNILSPSGLLLPQASFFPQSAVQSISICTWHVLNIGNIHSKSGLSRLTSKIRSLFPKENIHQLFDRCACECKRSDLLLHVTTHPHISSNDPCIWKQWLHLCKHGTHKPKFFWDTQIHTPDHQTMWNRASVDQLLFKLLQVSSVRIGL